MSATAGSISTTATSSPPASRGARRTPAAPAARGETAPGGVEGAEARQRAAHSGMATLRFVRGTRRGSRPQQRRFSVLGLPIAMFYKFVDDQGNYLAATITYYAFIAIFPLILLGDSILGFFLQNDPGSRRGSSPRRWPTSRSWATSSGGRAGSRDPCAGVVVGAVAALYGSLGLGQALQNANNVAWAVPRNRRPNPITLSPAQPAAPGDDGRGDPGDHDGDHARDRHRDVRHEGRRDRGLAGPAGECGGARQRAHGDLPDRHGSPAHPGAGPRPGAFAMAVLWQLLQYAGDGLRRSRDEGDHGHERHLRAGARPGRHHLPRLGDGRARDRGERRPLARGSGHDRWRACSPTTPTSRDADLRAYAGLRRAPSSTRRSARSR